MKKKFFEDALNKSGEWFFKIFDSNPIGMILTDLETTKFEYVNEAFVESFGYQKEDVIGKTGVELNILGPEANNDFLAKLNEHGFAKNIEMLSRKKSGELFWTIASVQSIEIQNRKFILTSFIDISERKKTEEQLSHLASIVESSTDAIFSKSLDRIIKSWNKGAEKMFGYSADQAIGKHVSMLIPPGLIKEKENIIERIIDGEIIDLYETVMLKKSGKQIHVSISASSLKDTAGNITSISVIARDITEQKKSEVKLNDANEELSRSKESLLNSLKEASDFKYALDESAIIGITDEKGIIKKVNNNFCKISKYSEQELIGKDHRIINSGFHSKEFIRDLWTTISRGKIWRGELKNKAKDGTFYWVDTTIVPFLNEDGKPYQYLAIRIDITKRKQSEAQLEIANKELLFQNEEKEKRAAELVIANMELVFQAEEKAKQQIVNAELEALNSAAKLSSQYSLSLIEASRDPLVTINTAGKITDMNEATVRITGESRENLRGTDFKNYFTDPVKAREVYREVFEKGFVADYPLTIMDHKLTDVLFNGSVYKDDSGNVLGAVVVARDITEQKRIEKELTEAIVFAELATGIAEIAKSKAESATQIAEAAVQSKQQFLSNMSHEIRTPMNAIIGFTKVILKTDLTAKQKEYLTAIKLSGDALIVLINDILDLAKVDAGKMTFELTPFRLELSISAMLHLFEPKIEEKNLKLVKEYDPKIPEVLIGDPVRLHQIILNLVSNAVKFTAKGKITVSVQLLSEDEKNATIEFSVTDTGIGIEENKISKIFENFQQASSGTSRLYGGTGLGLAIVKQLVEPQGGIIKVKSKVGVGSTFSFVLNFQKTTVQAEDEMVLIELDEANKNIKVLVVEDIPLNQLLMKTLLDDFGFERDIAANGKIAIEILMKKSFDIILMDLQMPEMNGFEATEYIRETMHSKIPIIALTADVTTVDLAKCKAVGMNDYIAKPVDEKLLYNKIVTLVKKPVLKKQQQNKMTATEEIKKVRCINLDYLNHRTKSNSKLMMEMISLYLEQTPPLVSAMKQSFLDKDWIALHAAAHKMIPSFSIMGISVDFENMAKKIQEYAGIQQQEAGIKEMVTQLDNVCTQACIELQEEFDIMKNKN